MLGDIGPCAGVLQRVDCRGEMGRVGGVAEIVGGFFADESELAEGFAEDGGDDGLRGEVGEGDGGAVVLGDGAELVEARLNVFADDGGLRDGVESEVELGFQRRRGESGHSGE